MRLLLEEDADYFDSASLKIVRGAFKSESLEHYVADVAFQAVVRTSTDNGMNGIFLMKHIGKRKDSYRMSD